MKTIFILIFGFLIILTPLFAKRVAPKVVKPIIHNGIEYRASNKMGLIEAWDLTKRLKLWEKRVYRVSINPLMERDVQDIFITELKMEGDKLVISNEQDNKYSLDLKTKKVLKY